MSRGLLDADHTTVAADVLACWDTFLATAQALAASGGLGRPSRLPGWTGREICIHIGRWDDALTLDEVLASARAGGAGQLPDADHDNARLVAAHRDASDAEILEALTRGRAALADFVAGAEFAALAPQPSMSVAGPLPVLTLLHAGTYELAVHALDLASCGAPAPPAALLAQGLGAMIDVTGLLCHRQGMTAAVTAMTPAGGWRFAADDAGWTTERAPAGPTSGTAVVGSLTDLLDASSGRAAAALLVARRRIRVHDLAGMLQLSPIVEQVPGLPGGAALRLASKALAGVGAGLAGAGAVRDRLPRFARRGPG